jgi:hypothetical protein
MHLPIVAREVRQMAKSKPRSTIMVADGAGGMRKMTDHRFEAGDWPISFGIPVEGEQADLWPRYLAAACHRRGWAYPALGQLERAENSGTINVMANGKPELEIVWERKRNGAEGESAAFIPFTRRGEAIL